MTMRPAAEVGFRQRLKAGPSRLKARHNVQQVACRTGKTIKPPDDDRVPLAQLIEQPQQFRPIAVCSGPLFLEDPRAARQPQSLQLHVKVLVGGRDPSITELHVALAGPVPLQNILHNNMILRISFATLGAHGFRMVRRHLQNFGHLQDRHAGSLPNRRAGAPLWAVRRLPVDRAVRPVLSSGRC
jgi:hypothetical protein